MAAETQTRCFEPAVATEAVMGMINAAWTTQVLRTVCELDLADHIARRPVGTAALGAATSCEPQALERLLRAMAALGLCERDDAGQHRLTPLGELLRKDAPRSLHHWARLSGGSIWRRFSELPESVRSGTSWTQRHRSMGSYEWLQADAEAEEVFHRAMVEATRYAADRLLPSLDLADARCVVDVGGGSGALLAAVLQHWPALRGVLFDQPAAIARAPAVLDAAAVAARCRLEAGDFFAGVPPDGDAYLLKSVLHNWDDARCRTILRHCAAAMSGASRLLVIERVRPDAPGSLSDHRAVAFTDLVMLVGQTGRERSEPEYRALLAGAGLRLNAVRPTSSEWAVLEACHA